MNWLSTYFTSSIGRKLVMSLTGLFLVLFLCVHLGGNLQLLRNDDGEVFNEFSYFMTHNPLIELISYGLYAFILLHTIQGLLLWSSNRKAKGTTYAVAAKHKGVDWASSNMALLGTLIFVFLVIHMGDFWFKVKFDEGQINDAVHYRGYEGLVVKDLYQSVAASFHALWYVIVYVIGMVVLYFHLSHGFQSAFQTLGLNHPKYTPIIQWIGKAYSILVPFGFAIIPIVMYFRR